MSIEPEHELSGIERAHLAVLSTEAGFKVLQTIMEDQINQFNVNLVNASNPDEIIDRHRLAKAAAQFYQGVINRVNHEISIYRQSEANTKPVDATEGLIDLGESDLESQLADIPNLLEHE